MASESSQIEMSAKKVVEPYFGISSKRVAVDLIFFAIISWGAYFICVTANSVPVQVVTFFLGLIYTYKGLAMNHEVSHFYRELKWFEPAYNLLFGFFHRVPAYTLKTHRYHHSIRDFSYDSDPEYETWTEKPSWTLLRPFFLSFLYPLFLTLRFGVLPLAYFLVSNDSLMKLYEKYSTFVMNLDYKRPYVEKEFEAMKRQDLWCVAVLIASIVFGLYSGYAAAMFSVWYGQIVVISIMNTYRALVAHRYQVANRRYAGIEAQLADSVNIEGGFFTSVWAPIGLNYHGLHHYFQKIPYYNLKKAHVALKEHLPSHHVYFDTIEPSFLSAFSKLYRSCADKKVAGRNVTDKATYEALP